MRSKGRPRGVYCWTSQAWNINERHCSADCGAAADRLVRCHAIEAHSSLETTVNHYSLIAAIHCIISLREAFGYKTGTADFHCQIRLYRQTQRSVGGYVFGKRRRLSSAIARGWRTQWKRLVLQQYGRQQLLAQQQSLSFLFARSERNRGVQARDPRLLQEEALKYSRQLLG